MDDGGSKPSTASITHKESLGCCCSARKAIAPARQDEATPPAQRRMFTRGLFCSHAYDGSGQLDMRAETWHFFVNFSGQRPRRATAWLAAAKNGLLFIMHHRHWDVIIRQHQPCEFLVSDSGAYASLSKRWVLHSMRLTT